MASAQVTTLGETMGLDDELITTFEQSIRGKLIRRGDPGYDEACRINNAMIERRPTLIVRCTGAADVGACVNFARTHNLLVSVRGGGHNVAGSALAEGGLVIDLTLMNNVRVDPVARTVRVGGGATWGDIDRETQLFGLATPGGVVSTTGVGGLTLGGGLGHLRRRYGTSCENLVSVDIITADGRLLRADAAENRDLFWGVRGGGGNFGVVTSFEFRLHPVGPLVAMVATMYPLEEAASVLRGWRDFMASAPDEISSTTIFGSMPPFPFVPADQRGRPVVIVTAVHAGEAGEGEQAMRPLRALGTPLADQSGTLPYTALQCMLDDFFPYGRLRCYWKSLYLDTLDDSVLDAIIERAGGRPAPESFVVLWHLGGAMSQGDPADTAFGRPLAPFLLSLDTSWTDPGADQAAIAWTRRFWSEMHAYSSGGLYLNFAGFGEEKDELVRVAYGPNYARLVELKNTYDPTNLFRLNQNIRPTV